MTDEDRQRFDRAWDMVEELCLRCNDVASILRIMRDAPDAYEIIEELVAKYGQAAVHEAIKEKNPH